MRQILFRGKRMDNSEWVKGSLISFDDNGRAILPSKSKAFAPRGGTCFCSNEFFLVDSDTVGQYTGLTDKNGRQIFEGDILQSTPNRIQDGSQRWKVEFLDGCFSLNLSPFLRKENISSKILLCEDSIYLYDMKVIGNVHDNPELL